MKVKLERKFQLSCTDDGGNKLTNKDTHKLFRTFYKLMKNILILYTMCCLEWAKTHRQYRLKEKRATQKSQIIIQMQDAAISCLVGVKTK